MDLLYHQDSNENSFIDGQTESEAFGPKGLYEGFKGSGLVPVIIEVLKTKNRSINVYVKTAHKGTSFLLKKE